MVQFILNSLPSEYGAFQINYNTMKDKWDVNELIGKLIQEENRLKNLSGRHSVNLVQEAGKALKPRAKNFKNFKWSPFCQSVCLWHKRLGHISKERLERLVKNEILPNLDFSNLDFQGWIHKFIVGGAET